MGAVAQLNKFAGGMGALGAGLQVAGMLAGAKSDTERVLDAIGELSGQVTQLGQDIKNGLNRLEDVGNSNAAIIQLLVHRIRLEVLSDAIGVYAKHPATVVRIRSSLDPEPGMTVRSEAPAGGVGVLHPRGPSPSSPDWPPCTSASASGTATPLEKRCDREARSGSAALEGGYAALRLLLFHGAAGLGRRTPRRSACRAKAKTDYFTAPKF